MNLSLSPKKTELGNPLNGLLLIDKPTGPTSFNLVQKIRRVTGQKSVGHIGTLDPLATGLMGLLLGQATKLSPYLGGLEKTYQTTVILGLLTDTLDVTGQTVSQHTGPWPGKEDIEAALDFFKGPFEQMPPAYSAVKIAGKPAYKIARSGKTPALSPRKTELLEYRLTDWSAPEATFSVRVTSGFYIRSLARDLGDRLGLGGGSVKHLRRQSIGGFSLTQAVNIPETREEVIDRLLTPCVALGHWPEIEVTPGNAQRLKHGQGLCLDNVLDNLIGLSVKITCPVGQLLAIGRVELSADSLPQRPFLRPLRVFES
jgi:tRNA pseudouridine55 synthase